MSVEINYHSSIRIDDGKVMYFDPWKVEGEPHDADVVFVTHTHFDHFSPEDAAKVMKADTVVVAPQSCRTEILEALRMDEDFLVAVTPGEELEVDGLRIEAVPAYNVGKDFHKREFGWCGYVVHAGRSYYVAGDTDVTPEVMAVRADVFLLPVGGKYTMDADEAAACVNELKVKCAIPTHYGEVAGDPDSGKYFAEQISGETEVAVLL